MSIELPPPPATLRDAMNQANELAYGFAKHTDPVYWSSYLNDPVYFWRRMLGWQAGGEDVARYGLYANPPSPWRVVEAPAPPPDVPAPPARDEQMERLIDVLQQIVGELQQSNMHIGALTDQLDTLDEKGVRVHL